MSSRHVGAALALLAAASFAAGSVFAKLAYAEGMSPLTLGASRTLCGAALNALALLACRRSLDLPAAQRNRSALLGILLALYSLALLEAIRLVPVAVAVLVFFTFPIVVVLAETALRGARDLAGYAWTGLAFCGLALALGDTAGALSAAGLALALAAAGGNAAMILLKRATPQAQVRASTIVTLAVAGSLLGGLAVLTGRLTWPGDTAAVLAVSASSLCYAVAITAMFFAIGRAGASHASACMNAEPILAIGFASAAFGDPLHAGQIVGAGLVVMAITVLAAAPRGAAKGAGAP